MDGVARTVNARLLLATPPTVAVTLPEVAPLGTVAVILVALQLDAVAVVPLNVTVLLPCVAPKFTPAIVTACPIAPAVGFNDVMAGSVPAVKRTPLLVTPPTVTVTGPVVTPVGAVAVIE